MSATRIGVSLGATINLGNYQTLRIDYTEERDVPEGMNIDTARRKLYEQVEGFLEEKVAEAREDAGQ